LEHLEDRCTPSTLLGDQSVQVLAHQIRPDSAAVERIGVNHRIAMPITVFLHCEADSSSMTLSATGSATGLGPWTTQVRIDNIKSDPVANRVVISGKLTIVTANHDKLFGTISSVWQQSSSQVEDTVIITGGTGRYAGVSGGISLVCHVTVDST